MKKQQKGVLLSGALICMKFVYTKFAYTEYKVYTKYTKIV